MEVIYRVNNRTFTDREEAEKYEKILAEDEAKRAKLKAEKESRKKEIEDAYQHYYDLLSQYEKDYDEYIIVNPKFRNWSAFLR